MENGLNEYLQKATNYLYPVSAELEVEYRKKIMNFCIKHGLDEKFLSLVETDSKWRDIAARKPVKYFVDIPKKLPGDERKDDEIIGIQIRLFEVGNPVPVIKITAVNNFLETC